MVRALFHKMKWGRWMLMIFIMFLFSGCYQMDDDVRGEGMADRREAQAYIVTSYNKLNQYLVRSDFEALSRLGQIVDEYQWDDKDASMQKAKEYAKMILNGDVSALQDIMDFCERNSGVYEADANKCIRKTSDAEHQIKMVFDQENSLSFAWNVKEKSSERMVIDLAMDFNQYRLAGQSRVYNDSVCSSYQMTKGNVQLMRLKRTLEGKNILAAIIGRTSNDGNASNDGNMGHKGMTLYSTDLRLQLMDMLCLHETETELATFVRYFEENHTLQVENPSKFLEGFIRMRDNMSRVVLTRPDGTVLCKITDEVGQRNGRDCIVPMLNWGDGKQQSLTDFASDSANKNFAQDAALLDKLWQMLYDLYYS